MPNHRWKARFSILMIVLFIMSAAIYHFRNHFAEIFLGDQLSKLGYPLQSVTAIDLAVDQLTIRNLIAGNNQELRFNEIRANWNWQDLLKGNIDSLILDGAYISTNLQPINRRSTTINSQSLSLSNEKTIHIPKLPALSINDLVIELNDGNHVVTILLSGQSKPHENPEIQVVHLNVAALGSIGEIKAQLQATSDTQGNIQGHIVISKGIVNLPEVQIADLTGHATFTLADLALQQLQTELIMVGIQQATLSKASQLSMLKADKCIIQSDIRQINESWQADLDLQLNKGQFVADNNLNIEETSISLPLHIKNEQDIWRIGLRNVGQIHINQLHSNFPITIKKPLSLEISRVDIELEKNISGINIKHDILINPNKFSAFYQDTPARSKKSIIREIQIDAGPINITGSQPANDVYRAGISLNKATLTLPEDQLKLSGISAHWLIEPSATTRVADFSIQQIKHLVQTAAFTPLSLSGSILQSNADKKAPYLLSLTAGTSSLSYLKMNGEYAIDTGTGLLTLQVVPMKFTRNKLQPKQIFPALAVLKDVNGQIGGKATIRWSKKGVLKSNAVISARDLAFTYGGTQVKGLNARLSLNNLLPIRSEPKQSISIQAIDFGMPIQDLMVSYQINSRSTPQVLLDQAHFLILGGKVAINPVVINLDPNAGASQTEVHLNNINLNTFFEWIQIDGLRGDGQLSGKIPLTLNHDRIAIVDGELSAKTPGVLSLQSEKVKELLAHRGEEVDLLLQAIEDFHFKELTLSLNKSDTHDLNVKLTLLGNNPNVKSGQDFRVNIQLESKIDKLLLAIQQGLLFSNKILQDSLQIGNP
ncbi:YdbH domain-containing protein [Nitrosomonas sp. PY1]|uniref:intermembrane phospholipid transport protein YdbH family protein n=1 Tax=Nitrosomonas sp. PY1 TaxID=1803906 RepID=UPI001FC7C673|nr:YdbH domain-containing protein [Nitrosomonas sp. PY1]